MDFTVVSASEINPAYREFCELNYPGRFQHFYNCLEDQVSEGHFCSTCQGSSVARIVGCDPKRALPSEGADLLVSGSPCTPFSAFRSGRYSPNSVVNHKACELTLGAVVDLYVKYEPQKGVLEQVWGFCQPLAAGGTETPKSRRVVVHFVQAEAKFRG